MVALSLPFIAACKPSPSPDRTFDAATVPVERATPVTLPPSMAASANALGWRLLSKSSERGQHLVAPLAFARLLLERADASGPESAAALSGLAFGGKPIGELLGAARSLEGSFSKHAAKTSLRLGRGSAPTSALQSAVVELQFEGHWHQRFERDRTHDGAFRNVDGTQVQLPFMVQSSRLPEHKSADFQLLELPYQDERFSLLLWIGNEPSQLSVLLERVAESAGQLGVELLRPRAIDLELPRFRLSEEGSLSTEVAELGLISTSSSAEAAATSRDWAQRVEFVVDEDGGEGEGSIAPVVGARVIGEPPRKVVVDRPFVFAVRDRPSNSMILIGWLGKARATGTGP